MFALALTLSFLCAPMQDAPPESAQAPADRAVEVLRAADQATRAVAAIRYEAEYRGTGALATRLPVVTGEFVKAFHEDRGEAGEAPMRFCGSGLFYTPGPQVAEPTRFTVAFDGERICRLDPENKVCHEGGPGDSMSRVLGPASRLDMREFGHPTPFADELAGTVQDYEGQTIIEGVLCDVVYVEYSGDADGQRARWFFGVEDHLPRRVERLDEVDGRAGAAVLTLRDLDVNPAIDEAAFSPQIPEDYRRFRAGGPRPTAEPARIR